MLLANGASQAIIKDSQAVRSAHSGGDFITVYVIAITNSRDFRYGLQSTSGAEFKIDRPGGWSASRLGLSHLGCSVSSLHDAQKRGGQRSSE
jgi:hypothetical protein